MPGARGYTASVDSPERTTSISGASMRVVLGAFGLLLLPLVYPSTVSLRPVFAVYLVVSAVSLVLIKRGMGRWGRALAFGVVDLAVLSWCVHATGSASSMLLAIYVLAGILNVLVMGRAVGLTIAALAALSYGAVVLGEQLRLLPYAPSAPSWIPREPPGPGAAATGWLLVSVMTVLATTIVARLVSRIVDHERELEEKNRELAGVNLRLQELSQRDPLTELYNRRYIMEVMERELKRVRRGGRAAVVMVDLDGFKRVNDNFGHLRGDALLAEIAAAVGRGVREVDVVGRYGGDEFLVIMPDTAGDEARIAAERLVQSVRAVGKRFDAERPVTASVGVAVARSDDEVRPLVQRADRAAYAAKQAGGDRALLDDAPISEAAPARPAP
jgi:diguanylate cyclase (GGDEF)-like protein